MWEFNHTDNMYVGRYDSDEELRHYGVLGMKWGVRRASRNLSKANSSGDKERGRKAIASLSKHRDKITKKLSKLDERGVKLEKKRYKAATKGDLKAAKLEAKAAKLQVKSMKAWSAKKAFKLDRKSKIMNMKASQLRAKSAGVKAKIEKNEKLKNTFNKSLKDVNNTLNANRNKFKETPEERALRITKKATILGGPLAGMVAGLISAKRAGTNKDVKTSSKQETKTSSKSNEVEGKNMKGYKTDYNNLKSISKKTYNKFRADDVEGVLNNMSKKQLDDVFSHVGQEADYTEISDYIARKYN